MEIRTGRWLGLKTVSERESMREKLKDVWKETNLEIGM